MNNKIMWGVVAIAFVVSLQSALDKAKKLIHEIY